MQQLGRVGALLQNLNKTCDDIRRHVELARQESSPVLEEAAVLMANKHETETKQQLLQAFRQHFIISDEDLTTLTSSVEPVNDRFFVVLTRIKQIHADCEILLGSENQRLGLELMEQTTRNLDAAFNKLYGWIQREFKGLDLEDPHISGSIRRALRVLSERPTMFQSCLDFFAEARQNTLTTAFQTALTEVTANSTKAIEFSSHDPLRYIGDMLAWVHSTTVSEKESLEGLFITDEDELVKGMRTGRAAEPWSRVSKDEENADGEEDDEIKFDGLEALNSLVSRNLSRVCQTLQNRIELAVRNNDDPVLVYKILNLLTFYQTMFTRQTGESTALTNCITTLETQTDKHFEDIVAEDNNRIMAEVGPPKEDLTPPDFLLNALSQLVDITRTKGSQLTPSEFEHLFSLLISTAVNHSSELISSNNNRQEQLLYKLNYLSLVHQTLQTISQQTSPTATTPSSTHVVSEIESTTAAIVETIQLSLLDDSGVGPLLLEIRSRRDLARHAHRRRSSVLSRSSATSAQPETDPDSQPLRSYLADELDAFARQLDAWLPFALTNTQEALKYVVDRAVVKQVINEAVEEFCDQFEDLEDLLGQINGSAEDEAGREPGDMDGTGRVNMRELYPRVGAEVRALLN